MSVAELARTKTYFEEFVAWAPDPFKGLARSVTDVLAQPLELIAGDPDDLIAAADECVAIGAALREIADEHGTDVATVRESWVDTAGAAFETATTDFRENVDELAEGLDHLQEILVAAAEASAEAFNFILEIIVELILWLVTEWILALAASVISAGASAAAAAVSSLAQLATALGRIGSIMTRLATMLTRLAAQLKKVAEFLKTYSRMMRELRKAKKAYAPWKKALYSKEGLTFQATKLKWVMPGKLAINAVSPVGIPGVVGVGLDAGMGIHDLASDGDKDRNYLVDGTYRDIMGRFARPFQDIIDSTQ